MTPDKLQNEFYKTLIRWDLKTPDLDCPFWGVFANGETYIFMLTEDYGLIDYMHGQFSVFDEIAKGFEWQDTKYPDAWKYI